MSFDELLIEFMPLFIMPLVVVILNTLLKLVQAWMRGEYTAYTEEELEKRLDEQIRKDKERNYIDDDLKKYFNYKE